MIGCWSKSLLLSGSLNIAISYRSTAPSSEQKVASVKEVSFFTNFIYLFNTILIISTHHCLPLTPLVPPHPFFLQIIHCFLFIILCNPLSLNSAAHMNIYVGSCTGACSVYQCTHPQKRVTLPPSAAIELQESLS